MSGVFHTYDIRGVVGEGPDQISSDFAYRLGQVLVSFSGAASILVCRDARVHSPMLFDALCAGITDAGADVEDLGVSTIAYMICSLGHTEGDLGVMITASHNPKEYNGFKINKKGPLQVYYEKNGLCRIEEMMRDWSKATAEKKGTIKRRDLMEPYLAGIDAFYHVPSDKRYKVVIDAGNGVGFITAKAFFRDKPNIEIIELYTEPDGNFPNHEANPAKFETLRDLQEKVKEENADLGVAYDGDADRVVFVDRDGKILLADQTTVLLADYELQQLPSYPSEVQQKKQSKKLYIDLRFSKVVDRYLEHKAIHVERMRVGNPFYKEQLFEHGGLMASEMSGHIMYPEHFNADDALFATAKMLDVLSSGIDLVSVHELFSSVAESRELNYKVYDAEQVIRSVEAAFADCFQTHLDGLTVESDADWWFVIRKSNTEPLVRARIEARTQEDVEQVRWRIEDVLRPFLT